MRRLDLHLVVMAVMILVPCGFVFRSAWALGAAVLLLQPYLVVQCFWCQPPRWGHWLIQEVFLATLWLGVWLLVNGER